MAELKEIKAEATTRKMVEKAQSSNRSPDEKDDAVLETDKDDLKYRSIAAYKALVKGDTSVFDRVLKKQVDLSACKGMALSDSSFEESDRMHVRLSRDEGRGRRRSQNSEALDSIVSKDDYWQDLENKKKDRYFTKQSKQEQERDEVKQGKAKASRQGAGNGGPNWFGTEIQKNLVAAEVQKVTKKYEEVIANMEKKFQNDISKATLKSRDSSIAYFREKTEAAISMFKQ
jgi:hypothetical protein